jgi:hypothetical protein
MKGQGPDPNRNGRDFRGGGPVNDGSRAPRRLQQRDRADAGEQQRHLQAGCRVDASILTRMERF